LLEDTLTKEETSTAAPTRSTGKEIEKKVEEITTQIAEETGIPPWGVVTIIIGKLNGQQLLSN